MALISLSDWMDRFGDVPATASSVSELESLRLSVDESPAVAAQQRGEERPLRATWRERLRQRWQREFGRVRRLATGHA